jgi:hypothetical protein
MPEGLAAVNGRPASRRGRDRAALADESVGARRRIHRQVILQSRAGRRGVDGGPLIERLACLLPYGDARRTGAPLVKKGEVPMPFIVFVAGVVLGAKLVLSIKGVR